ncbi:hypothetical protein AGABI1DRAFT_90753 [Agaricus bisporus var. burnettii JB137-S8]|uniref:Uncharacterized protein n=1 Tax=Agaricus bisporus var. burnettii (strain JB137-S8 / ATCC MYA-4627 / FGSC 10392) TaxID=597362 RepID=K5XCN2_AGABU|nr:uncharacterized protein AGABI1DRAFT_90753 [Agaricus bisporus var. burnettii JB137-S8]EKM80882.1 hypothetical protein AGABI1DRAFT_90753 [Agaricus bisporus var. burnettii JB137-S8]
MSSSPATAPTGPGAGLRPGTIQARLELDDNISNFHHRLSRFDSKQTTLRSVSNALAMVIPAAETLLHHLGLDPAALEHGDLFKLLFRTKRCFEQWQQSYEREYEMPRIYGRVCEIIEQKNRSKSSSGGGGPKDAAGNNKSPVETTDRPSLPPSKKRRRGKAVKSAEVVESSDTGSDEEEVEVVAAATPVKVAPPPTSTAMEVDDKGSPSNNSVASPGSDQAMSSKARRNSCSAVPDQPVRAKTVCIPYAKVPGIDTNSWAYKHAVQIITRLGTAATGLAPLPSDLNHSQAQAASKGALEARLLATT